ncbi:hypothetical protein [Peterkaempfera sp. SMS 1(5)a]|uniref:hypothetical protein n=1 Tax=Peterkaempfera podocarpi TaxID=3232308 RepID=UPI00366C720E
MGLVRRSRTTTAGHGLRAVRRAPSTGPGETGRAGSDAVALRTPLRAATVVLSLAVGVGAVVQTYRIGDSGAKAAWHDGFSATATRYGGG